MESVIKAPRAEKWSDEEIISVLNNIDLSLVEGFQFNGSLKDRNLKDMARSPRRSTTQIVGKLCHLFGSWGLSPSYTTVREFLKEGTISLPLDKCEEHWKTTMNIQRRELGLPPLGQRYPIGSTKDTVIHSLMIIGED